MAAVDMLRRLPGAEVFTSAKAFDLPWVGHPTLNRCGLHVGRIALSDALASARRWQLRGRADRHVLWGLRRDGVVVIPGVLEPARFERLRAEVKARVCALDQAHPPPPPRARGFGPRRPFEGGFDRYDGGTLNRFITLDRAHTPLAHDLLRDRCFVGLFEASSGQRFRPGRVSIQLLRHGDERRNRDIQKVLHRDTFHSAIKAWLFLDDVQLEHGPFAYVRGSHRMSRARWRWEHRMAVAAASRNRTGGAFRITETELTSLGLKPPEPIPVRRNTLVLADVRGFHLRSPGEPGTERLALHGSFRPSPFLPIAL